ncbi:hypothetical protein BBJ28_00026759 [Nothophytophthora sp. Chile5]|nr:hypothetical protein BBJ28_00026759 [Nothophytophthora sp. Chile5]
MSASRSPWGRGGHAAAAVAASVPSPAAVNLHDVMDEELAAKLQREEQEEWEREMEGRFGGVDKQTGWCFVEVPSACSEHGVMSVIQQEVSVEDEEDDPDYTFALELQAQEAEEYDRMRRQEASSMERIRVIRQEDPKREEIRQTLQRYYGRDGHREVGREKDDAVMDAQPQGVHVPMAQPVTTAAAATPTPGERPRLRHLTVGHGIYVDGGEGRVSKKKLNSLNSAQKQSDRKTRHRGKNASSSSGSDALAHRS